MAEQFESKDAYAYGTNLQVWLSGQIGKGGSGFLGNDTRTGPLELPSISFGILVVLIRKAKADASADLSLAPPASPL